MSDSASIPGRHCLNWVSAVFCTVLILSNLLAIKPLSLPGLSFIQMDAGNLLFPISYIFGDVLVEVYGYAQARRMIWMGFCLNLLAAGVFSLAALLPPAPGWEKWQEPYAFFFLQTPRVVAASALAFWGGSFLNAWIMAKMKIWTNGKHLWMRTIGSTIGGEGMDSLLFTVVAFSGLWSWSLIGRIILCNFLLKVVYEVVATPLTYYVIRRLKHAEQSDPYDRQTAFSPFRWRE